MTVPIYAVGAVLLALWLDARRPAPSLGRGLCHAGAALVILQLLPPALRALEADEATPVRLVAVLVLLILPTFVYAFFALCRLFRVIAALTALR